MRNKNPEENKGIRLGRLNIVLIVMAVLLFLLLIYSTYSTMQSYSRMQEATERYIDSQKNASDMQSGSDYLTEQVRLFVFTGDIENLNNYFKEKDVTRRRDKAIENLSEDLSGSGSIQYLREALQYSNELVDLEYHAMRLAIEGFGYEVADFPSELQNYALPQNDLAMTPAEQLEKARSMVFDDHYQDYKEKISSNVSLCIGSLVDENRGEQMNSSDTLLRLLRLQRVLIGILVLMVFAVIFLSSHLIIRPLMKSVDHIRNQEPMPVQGAYEFQFVASEYNAMYENTKRSQEQLAYDASHDALTGLYNRSVFQNMQETVERRRNALIMADLDGLKQINDTYGHDAGDRAIKRVADLLRAAFRAEDYVCRIGGDEFAVIMIHAGSELKELVSQKIEEINRALKSSDDELPGLSLSVGVAFSDRENPNGDIYKDADTALYRAKTSGKGICVFY